MGRNPILVAFLASLWLECTAFKSSDGNYFDNYADIYANQDSWNKDASSNHLAVESFLENVLKAEEDLNWIKQVARQKKEQVERSVMPDWRQNTNGNKMNAASTQSVLRSDQRYNQLIQPDLHGPIRVEDPACNKNTFDANGMHSDSQLNMQTTENKEAFEGSDESICQQSSASNVSPNEGCAKREVMSDSQVLDSSTVNADHSNQLSRESDAPLEFGSLGVQNNYDPNRVKYSDSRRQTEASEPLFQDQVDSILETLGDGVHCGINRRDTKSEDTDILEQYDGVVDPSVPQYFEKHGRKLAARGDLVSRSCGDVKFPVTRVQKQEQERQRLQLEDADGLLKGIRDSSQIGSIDNQMEINKLNRPTMQPVIISYRHASEDNHNLDPNLAHMKHSDEIKSACRSSDANNKLYNKVDVGDYSLLEKHPVGCSSLDHHINKREESKKYSQEIDGWDYKTGTENDPSKASSAFKENIVPSSKIESSYPSSQCLLDDSELKWDDSIESSSEKQHGQSHSVLSGFDVSSSGLWGTHRDTRKAVKRPSALMEADGVAYVVSDEGEEGIDRYHSGEPFNEKVSRTSDYDSNDNENHKYLEHPKYIAELSHPRDDYIKKYMSVFKPSKNSRSNVPLSAVNDFSIPQAPNTMSTMNDAARLRASYIFPSKFDVPSGIDFKGISEELLKNVDSSDSVNNQRLDKKHTSKPAEYSQLLEGINQDKTELSAYTVSSQASKGDIVKYLSELNSYNNGKLDLNGDVNKLNIRADHYSTGGSEQALQNSLVNERRKEDLQGKEVDSAEELLFQSQTRIKDHVNQRTPANDDASRSSRDSTDTQECKARSQLPQKHILENIYPSSDIAESADKNAEILPEKSRSESSNGIKNTRRVLLSVSDSISGDGGTVLFSNDPSVDSAFKNVIPCSSEGSQENHVSFHSQATVDSGVSSGISRENIPSHSSLNKVDSLQTAIESNHDLPILKRVKRSDLSSRLDIEGIRTSSDLVYNYNCDKKNDESMSNKNDQRKREVPQRHEFPDIGQLTITDNDGKSNHLPLVVLQRDIETAADSDVTCLSLEEDEDENGYKTSDQHEGLELLRSKHSEALPKDNEYFEKLEDFPHKRDVMHGFERYKRQHENNVKDSSELNDQPATGNDMKGNNAFTGYPKNGVLGISTCKECNSKAVFKRNSNVEAESTFLQSEGKEYNSNKNENERDENVLNDITKDNGNIHKINIRNNELVGTDNNPPDITDTGSVKVLRDTSLKRTFPYLKPDSNLNLIVPNILSEVTLDQKPYINEVTPSYNSVWKSPVYPESSNFHISGLTGKVANIQDDSAHLPTLQGIQKDSYGWGQNSIPAFSESVNPYLSGIVPATFEGGNEFARSVTSCACRTTTTAPVCPFRTPHSTPFPSISSNFVKPFSKVRRTYSAKQLDNKYRQGRHMGISYSPHHRIIGNYKGDVNYEGISSYNKGSGSCAKNGELDDGQLAMDLVSAVFKKVDQTPSLKKVIGPGLQLRFQATPVLEFEDNHCKCHHMLNQIMHLMDHSGAEGEDKEESAGLPPDLKQFNKWLTKNSPISENPHNKLHHLIPRRTTACPIQGAKVLREPTNWATEPVDVKSKREVLSKLLSQYSGLQDKEQLKLKPIHDYLVRQEDFLNTMLDTTPFQFAPMGGGFNSNIGLHNVGDMQKQELIEKNLESLGLGNHAPGNANLNSGNIRLPNLSYKRRRAVYPSRCRVVPSKCIPTSQTRHSSCYIPAEYKQSSSDLGLSNENNYGTYNGHLSMSHNYARKKSKRAPNYRYVERLKRHHTVNNRIRDARQTPLLRDRPSIKYKRLVAREAEIRRKRRLGRPKWAE